MPLTLLDFPKHVAATIFLGGCPWRCPFCHNPDILENDDQTKVDEVAVMALLKGRRSLLEGVCISGGEPLMHASIGDFLKKLKSWGYAIKVDTNGAYPKRLKQLCEQKLIDYVALDIKNDPLHYGITIGRADFDITPVRETLQFLKKSSIPYECRTTVVREFHNEKRLLTIARWIAPTKNYYLQNFRDTGNLLTDGLHAYEMSELESFLEKIHTILPHAKIR